MAGLRTFSRTLMLVLLALAALSGAVVAQDQTSEAAANLPQNDLISFDMLRATPADVQAYYIPNTRYDGKTLDVVVNASQLSGQQGPVFAAAKSTFEALTGATINFIPLPENQMYDQVRLEMSTNSGAYDMMATGAGSAKDYGLDGFLVPLPLPPDASDFFQGDLHQYMVGDTLYGLPWITDTNILYWRTDLFEQAGLDPTKPPTTYDELRADALKLTTDVNGKHPGEDGFDANNIEIYGLGYKGVAGLASTWEWYNYLYAFGGSEFDKDYNVTIDSPEAINSLQWVVDNFRTYHIYPPDTPSYDYTEFHTLFIQGKMAMAINWPYMYAMAQDASQSKVVGKVAIGAKPCEVTCGGNIGGWSWNVFKMSDTPDLAIAFAKWMVIPDIGFILARDAANAPVRDSVAAVMSEKDPVVSAAIAANQKVGRGVGWLATGPSWMQIEQIQEQAIQEALTGSKDVPTALHDAKTQIDAILTQADFKNKILPQLVSTGS